MAYSFTIAEVVRPINETLYEVNRITITNDNAKFEVVSSNPFVAVSDSGNRVSAFLTELSVNQKELSGYFTTDAFDIFPADVTIEFGFSDQEPLGAFENVDIPVVKIPLSPSHVAAGAPPADNAWLDAQ